MCVYQYCICFLYSDLVWSTVVLLQKVWSVRSNFEHIVIFHIILVCFWNSFFVFHIIHLLRIMYDIKISKVFLENKRIFIFIFLFLIHLTIFFMPEICMYIPIYIINNQHVHAFIHHLPINIF